MLSLRNLVGVWEIFGKTPFSLNSLCYNKEIHCSSNSSAMHDIVRKKPFMVCVEGNIGCGKTTLLNYYSKFPEVEVLHEPIEKWTNLKQHNLLDLLYKDPSRWSTLFQTYVQLTMMEQHLKPCSKPTKIIERSLFSARYCFVENLYRTKMMTEPEYIVYCEWFKMITNKLDCSIDLLVYLRTDPNILNDRIKMRNRKEEKQIPIEYLKGLHDLHEEWLIKSAFRESTPVLVIDANGSLSQMSDQYIKHMNSIVKGIPVVPPLKLLPSPSKNTKKHKGPDRQVSNQAASIN